jgi:hypothetical protein
MSPSDRPKPPNKGAPQGEFDPDAPPSEDERRAADALRRALDGRAGALAPGEKEDVAAPAAELVQSIRAAASPVSLSAERHQQILDRALGAAASSARDGAPEQVGGDQRPATLVRSRDRRSRSKITYLAWGFASSLVAMAAAIALVIRSESPSPSMAAKASAVPRPAFALARSTTDLFSESFPRSGGTTGRVDRIAYARAQDLRENRFARWGTR